MSIRMLTIAVLLAVTAPVALAGGRGTPIIPIENQPLGTTTLATAEQAIRLGAARREWIPEVVSPELVRCRLINRGHCVVVDVPHTADSFSIRYVDSSAMDYNAAAGTIHRKYNQWTANLAKDIQTASFAIGPAAAPAQ